MAAIITIFTGISAIYGFSSPALDAVSGKAVKFAVGSLVPVVGTFLSDTLETVVSGTRLMKNAVGTSGIIVMCVICVLPILKIGVIQLMLKLTSSIAEPLTDKPVFVYALAGVGVGYNDICGSGYGSGTFYD